MKKFLKVRFFFVLFSMPNKKTNDFCLVSPENVLLGCTKPNDRLHEYVVPNTFDTWKICREECFSRGTKVLTKKTKTSLLKNRLFADCFVFSK